MGAAVSSNAPTVTAASIPDELRARPQWVAWRYETRDGKPTKVPYDARAGHRASATDPATWATFGEAFAAFEGRGDFHGVGYVLAPDDPYVAVDLDDCIDDAGQLAPWAQYHVEGLWSYTEVTPSGRGLRIFVRGTLPPGRRRRGQLEVYDSARYMTLTGNRWPGAPAGIADRAAVLDMWHADAFADDDTPEPRPQLAAPVDLDDAALIEKARANRKTGTDFDALWRGDTSGYNGDDSRADYHLARRLLFWAGGDVARADRLFRQSGLYRPKWDERRGATTYGERTLAAAYEHLTAVYTGAPPTSPNGNGRAPDGAAPAPARRAFRLTDYGNAERLVYHHGEGLRYCRAWGKWLVWDGRRWQVDATGEVERRAKATVRRIDLEAAAIEGDDDESRALRNALRRWATASESSAKIDAMIRLATSEPGIPVTPDELDADPWLLNCLNGTLDLRTGALRPHNPADMITKLAPVDYNPAARSTTWESFLADATGADELARFLARAVGYSLTGDTGEEVLFFIHGPAAAGKSTFLEAIKDTLGDYGTTADFETLLWRPATGGPRNDIARLDGARLVCSIEVDEGKRLAEGLVKMLTGGDRITARFLFRESFEFTPTFKLWLAANHAPRVDADDEAMWRRILLVPFTRVVPKARRDPKLKARLRSDPAERAAILAWAVRGCLEWQCDGLRPPLIVEAATQAYRAEMNPLSDFIADACLIDPQAWAPGDKLKAAYEAWALKNGETPVNARTYGKALRACGATSTTQRTNAGVTRGWKGIGLLTAPPSNAAALVAE